MRLRIAWFLYVAVSALNCVTLWNDVKNENPFGAVISAIFAYWMMFEAIRVQEAIKAEETAASKKPAE